MPNNSCEDLLPRNVPRPAPLIEVAPKPSVPEVSLLLDQDKNKSILITGTQTAISTSPNFQNGTTQDKYYTTTQNRESINAGTCLEKNVESFSSWKTKNPQALHNIAGSLGKIERARNIVDNSHTQNLHSRESKFDSKIHGPGSSVIKMQGRYMTNNPAPGSCSNANENVSHRYNHYSHSQQPQDDNPNTLVKNQQLGYSDTRQGRMHLGCPIRDVNQAPEECHRNIQNNLPLNHTLSYRPQVDFNAQKKYLSNEFHDPARPSNNVYPEKQMTDHYIRDQGQHLYSEERFGEFSDSNNYLPANNFPTDNFQMPNVKHISTLDKTVIDLYKIIQLQNDQILMLKQQVQQVLQIHFDCERTVKYKTECHNCCMERKVTNGNICCSNASKDNNDDFEKSPNRIYTSPCIDKPKRSVGVMTSSQENGSSVNEDSRVDNKGPQKMKHTTKIGPSDSSSLNQNTQRENRLSRKEGRAKLRSTSKPSKKQNKPDLKNSPMDNSFSLNEAEIVIRTSGEQDDISPDNSVHVDLQDYCSSSNASDTSGESATSTSNEEDSDESNSDQSSEPHLGWTFYNGVLGQVNNILKTSTPPRQEQTRKMRTVKNVYGRTGESPEAEINWSKRVTFDGPILEDSDNNFPNIMQMPRFHQLKQQKGARVNGVPGTMQDFRMYNIANGNTNHSFATLRYLERYHLLPPQISSQVPEYSQAGYQISNKPNKTKKKKSRIRNPDLYSDLNFQGHKKKSNATSSKLLDVTALKQQPKLF